MNDHKKQKTSSTALITSQKKLGEILEDASNPILLEALLYLRVVSVVDKKIVCKDWEKKCQNAINNKGRPVKISFTENKELRDEVKRYCEGNSDNIEKIAEEFGYPIGKWDVSKVKDFSSIFCSINPSIYTFNEDINDWNVGNGTNMRGMFASARSFNGSLSRWNVSNVNNMQQMFDSAVEFDGNVSAWDTSKVNNMSCMFCHARKFNGDVSAWDVSNVTNMSAMFCHARKFNGDVSAWDVSNVTDMSAMFYSTREFNGDVSAWDTSKVVDGRDMFSRAIKFNLNILN